MEEPKPSAFKSFKRKVKIYAVCFFVGLLILSFIGIRGCRFGDDFGEIELVTRGNFAVEFDFLELEIDIESPQGNDIFEYKLLGSDKKKKKTKEKTQTR